MPGPLPDSFLRIPGPDEEPMTAEERDREMAIALQVQPFNDMTQSYFVSTHRGKWPWKHRVRVKDHQSKETGVGEASFMLLVLPLSNRCRCKF